MTKDRIQLLKAEAKRLEALATPGLHKVNDGPGLHGLYLQIGGPTARSWVYRYMRAGKQKDLGLGSAFLFSLEEASKRADKARQLHAAGGDPVAERKAEKLAARLDRAKDMTFKQVAEEYIAQHSPAWKNAKHREQWSSTLATYVYPQIGSLPIQAINVAMVLDIIRPIWLDKTETASRVRGRIEAIIDYATPQYRIGDNPARWQILKSKLPKREKISRVEHHPALPFDEIPEFVADLRNHTSTSALCLEFLILTAVRTGDIRGQEREDRPPVRWSDVDFGKSVWTIPATKNSSEHRVPLSDRAVAILREMQKRREGELVFPGAKDGKPLSDAALSKMLTIMQRQRAKGGKPKWIDPKQGREVVPHGFRSTFRDWAGERTNFPKELAEKALAHTIGDETERAYQRGDLFDKRRRLMDAWAAFAGHSASLRGAAQ
jgi:integrase